MRLSPALRFEDVYPRSLDEVRRWVRSLGAPPADREDLIQDVFLIVHRRLHAFDGRNLPGWLYQITRHRVNDFRRLCWVRLCLGGTPPDDLLPASTEGPEQALDNKETERLLARLLSKLSEPQRKTFVMFELEGYTGEEIAALHDVPVNTVRARLFRARARLAASLKNLPRPRRAPGSSPRP